MEELEDVAVCQATKTPLSEDQTMFMKSVTDKRFGSGTATYLGWPSYEFVTPIDQRLTDEEFEAKLPWMRAPQWAEKSYLCSAFGDASSDEEN
ncbi:hypothetical protein KRP22_008631 [Phytophthora ramorum]|nr:hypothetical protein KRP22_7463 [Phytophthora ramorum]